MKKLILLSVCSFLCVFHAEAHRHGGPSEEMREAMESCASELGIERPSRENRLSRDQIEKLDSCLSEKGFEKPVHKIRRGQRDQTIES